MCSKCEQESEQPDVTSSEEEDECDEEDPWYIKQYEEIGLTTSLTTSHEDYLKSLVCKRMDP